MAMAKTHRTSTATGRNGALRAHLPERGSPRGDRARRAGLATLFALAGASAHHAQDLPIENRIAATVGKATREQLAAPEARALFEERLGGRFARVLEDLDLEFRSFESAADDDLALGVSFDLAKSRPISAESERHTLEFVAHGDIAFEHAANPHDSMSAAVRLRWSGTHAMGPGDRRVERAAKLADPEPAALAAADPTRFAELSRRYTNEPSPARLRADPDFQALARRTLEDVRRGLAPEWIWDTDLHAGLEASQDLSARQVVFGGALGARLVSWNPDARLSRLNAFDFPAAAVRWLAGQDEDFRPSGQAFPALALGLDVVDAARDEARSALTDDASFLRARLEAGLRSELLDLEGETLFLDFGWRLYQEVDAPGAVRDADAERSSYVELSLELPRGWALTYAAGELPLDAHYDSSLALGYELHL